MWMASVRTVTNAAANDNWDTGNTTGHVVKIGRLIHELIHGRGNEFAEADFDDRSLAKERRSNGCTDHGGFGNRCVTHPVWAEFGEQAAGALQRTTHLTDVLADVKHPRIA